MLFVFSNFFEFGLTLFFSVYHYVTQATARR
jgi:hypothetical protein